MVEFLFVGAGGFVGSCFRYLISRLFAPLSAGFPWATLVANVIAGFLIGVIFGAETLFPAALSERAKLLLKTGVMGGLSTFSAFSLETVRLMTDKRYAAALGNVALNVGLCVAAVMLGMMCVNMVGKLLKIDI